MFKRESETGNLSPTCVIEIKRLGSDKWEEYRTLRLEALKESSIAFGSSYMEALLLNDEHWKAGMKDVLFALTDGLAVGMLMLAFNQRTKTRHLAEIFSFYVNKEYRGRGAGKKLMDAALAEARARVIVKVRLSVNPEQKIDMRLYRRHGFKIVARLKKELLINGRFHDEVIMEKFL
jgi:ribosomal protein S18 acetylase RimI-like enzyme